MVVRVGWFVGRVGGERLGEALSEGVEGGGVAVVDGAFAEVEDGGDACEAVAGDVLEDDDLAEVIGEFGDGVAEGVACEVGCVVGVGFECRAVVGVGWVVSRWSGVVVGGASFASVAACVGACVAECFVACDDGEPGAGVAEFSELVAWELEERCEGALCGVVGAVCVACGGEGGGVGGRGEVLVEGARGELVAAACLAEEAADLVGGRRCAADRCVFVMVGQGDHPPAVLRLTVGPAGGDTPRAAVVFRGVVAGVMDGGRRGGGRVFGRRGCGSCGRWRGPARGVR